MANLWRGAVPISALLCACLVTLGPARASAAATDPDSLYQHALRLLARGTAEDRQFALRELERAVQNAGRRIDLLHATAWTYTAMGHYGQAHLCLERIT